VTPRRILAEGAAAALVLVLLVLVQRRGSEGAAEPPRGGGDAALVAEVYVVEPSTIQETVQAVGTLAANESVDVVAELSRRLVAVDVTEGTAVEKGQRLFKLDDADLRAELERLEARRRLAARTEQRQRALLEYEKKALSQQAYDQAVSELQAVEAEIAALRVTLARTEIRAPFAARVGLRRVSEGAWITPQTVMITLQDLSRIKVDFSLPERYAGDVALGQLFRFRVAGRGDVFEGRVIAVEPAIEASSRSLRVRGIADNPTGALLPGASASVEVPMARTSQGILVPAEAVVPSVGGHSLYVIEDGRAAQREVQIGLRTQDAVEILRGVELGDQVLTTNLLRVRPGARVEVARATAGAAP
jgi:membrane fusion protein (multidrug efflux system)